MGRRKVKFLLLGVGIMGSMALLVLLGLSSPGGMVHYRTVSEFAESPDRETNGFRINGKVQQGSIVRAASGQDVSFMMTDESSVLAVRYHGIIPDTFVDGAEVVVEGRLQDDEVFLAHTLLAKCPSKYESADPEEHDAATETSSL